MTDILFECDRCDGPVVLRTGPGRRREFRQGVVLEVPEDFPIATCVECGETYLTTAEAERLEGVFKARLSDECKELVDAIIARTGLNQKRIEEASGLTPTYLSHVLNGRKQPSATLIRLLECFARYEYEAIRHLEGVSWRAGLFPEGAPAEQRYQPAGEPVTPETTMATVHYLFPRESVAGEYRTDPITDVAGQSVEQAV